MIAPVSNRDHEARRRRRARLAPRQGEHHVSPRPYVVAVDPEGEVIEAWSTKRLPFQATGWLADLRVELHGELIRLWGGSDRVLAATYGSPDSDLCDVENVLLYNVGARALRMVARNGLRIERSFSCPEPPIPLAGTGRHYMRYELSSRTGDFQAWSEESVLAEWTGIPMPVLTEASKPASIWFPLANADIEPLGLLEVQRPFAMRLVLEVPANVHVAPAKVIKPLADGTVAAFHCHDGSALSELSRRVSAQIALQPDAIAQKLVDDRHAVLGPRRLLHAWGKSVQWNPADDRCLALELLLRHGDRFALSGRLSAITPSAAAQPGHD